MQALVVGGGARYYLLAHGYEVHGVVGRVDDRGGGDADLGCYLAATAVVGGDFARPEHAALPEQPARVGVVGIDGVVLGGDVDDVVGALVGEEHFRLVQRGSIHLAVGSQGK